MTSCLRSGAREFRASPPSSASACSQPAAFLGGIQAQKQWGDDDAGGGTGLAARLAVANGANGPATDGNPGPQGTQSGGVFGRGAGGFTTGTVKMVQGSTLYVTTTEGNTVKVSVPATSTVTKTVAAKVSGIKVGDTVTAIGTTTKGIINASSVRVGDTGLPAFRTGGPRANGQSGGQAPPAP